MTELLPLKMNPFTLGRMFFYELVDIFVKVIIWYWKFVWVLG